MAAFGSIAITGVVEANGTSFNDTQGSGGSIVLRAIDDPIIVGASALVRAVAGDGNQNGYIRVESNGPISLLGTIQPPASTGVPARVDDRLWVGSRLAPFELTELAPEQGVQGASVATQGAAFGVATSLRGVHWMTFPEVDEIHPYGRDGLDLLPGKSYSTSPDPRGIAVDRFDFVWVACASGALERFDSFGYKLASYPLPGSPTGVAIDRENKVWVTCENSNLVHRIDRDGTILGSFDVGDGPRGIATGPDGEIVVTLRGPLGATVGSVAKLDLAGNALWSATTNARPLGVAVDATGRVWVACEGSLTSPGNTVRAFAPNGNTIGTYVVGQGPTSVSVAGDGSIWVVNSGSQVAPDSTVMRLNPETGTVIETFPVAGAAIAFGDSTGYQLAMTCDPLGDADGDGDPNLQEMQFTSNPFDDGITSSGAFHTVDSIEPGVGLLAGGDPVTIRGSGFTFSWDTNVRIGSVLATDVVVVDTETITARTSSFPAQGRLDVVVANSNGPVALADGFYASNVVLSMDPAGGELAAPGLLNLDFRTLPLATPFLAYGPGVGTFPFGDLTLELTFPTILIDPTTSPFSIAADFEGLLTLPMLIPYVPSLIGTQHSFAAAILDPSCPPFGLCFSNGVVVSIQ